MLVFRDISLMPTWAEEAQRSIWDWQMYVLVYLRPLSQGSLQNSYNPISPACSCLSQLCQEKVGLVQRLVKAAHLIVAVCRVQDKFPSLSSVVSKHKTLKGSGGNTVIESYDKTVLRQMQIWKHVNCFSHWCFSSYIIFSGKNNLGFVLFISSFSFQESGPS